MASTESDPTHDEWETLILDVKTALLPEMGEETWYLIIASILSTSPRPVLLSRFWTHLTSGPQHGFTTAEAQVRLATRLRDLLLKQITLIGAPQVLSALIPLAAAQAASPHLAATSDAAGDDDDDSRPELSPTHLPSTFPELLARGSATITSIYGDLWPRIFSTFGARNRGPVGAHELAVVYGLYLSDFSVLSALETEAAVFACITVQGLKGPSLWHVRGLGRVLGARGTDDAAPRVARVKDVLRGVKVAMMGVVEFVGEECVRRSRLEDPAAGWANVGDVQRELGGWGDDDEP